MTYESVIRSANMSGSSSVLCELSRWWIVCGRAVPFVFVVLLFMPVACSDDMSLTSQGARFRYVYINITYMEEDREVSKQFKGFYGKQSIVSSVSGVVVHAENHILDKYGTKSVNHFGCTAYNNKKFPSEIWIALVERGVCNFANKIRTAVKEHNASAIVIYNNISGAGPTVMDYNESFASIAVLIPKEDGQEIAHLIQRGYTVYMHMKPGHFGTLEPAIQNTINKTSVLFVSISFIVLMIVSLAWLIFYYIQRFRYSHAKERLARRLAYAAKKAITKIPQRTLKLGDKELDSDYDQCAVCIEPYKFHEVIRTLPCRHVFHKSCVDPWLLDQRSCPMCKMDILRAYGMQIGGSQESLRPNTVAATTTVRVIVQEEPEVISGVEDAQTDDAKTTLVTSCLQFSQENNRNDIHAKLADDLQGAVGGFIYTSSSMSSLSSKGSSGSNTRAEEIDKTGSYSSEMKALIGKGKARRKQWQDSEEGCCDDVVEDVEDFIKDFGEGQPPITKTFSVSERDILQP